MLRRAVGSLLGAGRSALRPGAVFEGCISRSVTNSAPVEQAAAAAATATGKQPNIQEFSVYRWSPESEGKPVMQTYKVRERPDESHGPSDLADM